MYQNFTHLGNDKWEVYAEVVREIYCEIGNFEKSEKTYRDSQIYENYLKDKSTNNQF